MKLTNILFAMLISGFVGALSKDIAAGFIVYFLSNIWLTLIDIYNRMETE